MNSCTLNLRYANPKYQHYVDVISEHAGLPFKITVYASDTANACATYLYNNTPIITYNPRFIRDVELRNEWSVIAIFAHEVAHHYNQDVRGNYAQYWFGTKVNKDSHRRELNADRFAGWFLRQQGVSLQEALVLYNIVPFYKSESHPAGEKRKIAMEEGWRYGNYHVTPPPPKVEPAIDGEKLMKAAALSVLLILGIRLLGGK